MMRKRKTVVAKRVTPKVMTGIPKSFGILNDPLGNQMESKLMEKEEAEQRRCDRFWGQDKDLHDREIERKLMAEEDACSLKTEKWHETVAIQRRWDEEYQRNVWFENRSEAKYKEIERREYLKFISSSLSSDEVIGFVWGKKSGSASIQSNQHESQGLVFSDLSAIGKEVALSLPSAVGALHMSIHLDGLQQSRAIVDEASTAFKQTLRRINTQSADDGDAAQPFKTNALAASIISDAKKQQKKNTASPSKSTLEGNDPPPAVPAAPVHIPALDGHALHKWDQELMLQMAFMSLDKGGTGSLTHEEVAAVSFESGVHSLLSFTVFWATIKKRNWAFFQGMRGQAQPGQSGPSEQITLHDWMRTAQALSFEMAVPLRHVRTQEEHEEICRPAPGPGRRRAVGVGAANVFSGLPEREHRVSRILVEGDCVWALHNGGVMWLPAVVKAVHFLPPASTKFGSNAHRNTVTYSPYCYDLWYPLSQKELTKARTAMASRQLLALPSQVQAQRVLQEKQMMMRLAAEGENAASASMASVANFSKCLPPKPLADERKVCAYAFDLVDGGGEGVVPLHRLVQCLQSLEFSRVVATSLALSAIFHGGSHAGLHGVDRAAAGQPAEAGAGTEAGEKPKKVTAPGSTADIPSLLPVFIDTFSAPAEEEAELSEGDEMEEQDEASAQGGADGEHSVSATGGEGSEDGSAAQAQKRSRARKAKKAAAAAAAAAPPALDWISKLDFLEFCQAVADIKRYSVVVSQ